MTANKFKGYFTSGIARVRIPVLMSTEELSVIMSKDRNNIRLAVEAGKLDCVLKLDKPGRGRSNIFSLAAVRKFIFKYENEKLFNCIVCKEKVKGDLFHTQCLPSSEMIRRPAHDKQITFDLSEKKLGLKIAAFFKGLFLNSDQSIDQYAIKAGYSKNNLRYFLNDKQQDIKLTKLLDMAETFGYSVKLTFEPKETDQN